jgi:hypothetical protein
MSATLQRTGIEAIPSKRSRLSGTAAQIRDQPRPHFHRIRRNFLLNLGAQPILPLARELVVQMLTILRRLSLFRWTWEWGLLLMIGFCLYSGMISRVVLGSIELPGIESGGDVAEAKVLRADAWIMSMPTMDKAVLTLSLEWQDRASGQRRADHVRVDPELFKEVGGILTTTKDVSGFAVMTATPPPSVPIRYQLRSETPPPSSMDDMLVPNCRPYSNCNVLVLNQQGQSKLAARWRFFYEYDRAMVWLCVATFVGLQIARLGGWIGREG